jgi:Golgi apyrase
MMLIMVLISGLSSFADDPEGVEMYLRPLLLHARSHVPPSLQRETPLFLLATAGMRLLSPQEQANVLLASCKFLKLHSNFRIEDPSQNGPCGSSVRIITGEEEGLFGWIAVNYLMDGFTGSSDNRTTYGFLDMGGASTQIAFEPKITDRAQAKNLIDVRLRLLGGQEIHHQVFVTTWLGYGTNQARERYVGKAISEYEVTRPEPHGSSTEDEIVPDPCLPKNLQLKETPVHSGSSTSHSRQAHTLRGIGSFEQCLQKTSSLLNKGAPCPDGPCLFNGVHVPPIDFSVSHFIGVSEYWYSSEHVFGLGGPYDFVQYERAASEFCARDWTGIVKQHDESRRLNGKEALGGDGEVVGEGGRIVQTGEWGPQVERSRLEMQCFKAAWIANVLHEGIGMPRIVDPGGNGSTDGDKVALQAETKGLGRPTFQSVDQVGDIAISWTLGKMVLEASKEVPPLSTTSRPLVDPIDDIPATAESHIKPIRPPFLDLAALEDQLSQHLPSSLSRTSLGFSPILIIIYAILLFTVTLMTYRLRYRLGASCRRLMRPKKREIEGQMEEGIAGNGSAFLSSYTFTPSQLLKHLRRMLSPISPRPRLPPLTTSFSQKTHFRTGHSVPPRLSPTWSYSMSSPQHQNGYSSSSQYVVSRSPSPSPAVHEDANGLTSLASRSSLNLSTLVPRPGSLSRVNSTLLPPAGVSHCDE